MSTCPWIALLGGPSISLLVIFLLLDALHLLLACMYAYLYVYVATIWCHQALVGLDSHRFHQYADVMGSPGNLACIPACA